MAEPILILYASRRGDTERVARRIGEILTEEGLAVRVEDVRGWTLERLLPYRFVLLGSSTIGDGDIQPSMETVERRLRDADLSAWAGAAFGTGASRYVRFGWAADLLEARLRNSGARILMPRLKVDTLEGLNFNETVAWARRLAEALKEAGAPLVQS